MPRRLRRGFLFSSLQPNQNMLTSRSSCICLQEHLDMESVLIFIEAMASLGIGDLLIRGGFIIKFIDNFLV